ncbi:MAG: hypothetical protein MUQ30_13640, partial [Anaerolineae bacterium]|nr:hypothetical protein [Anaerolineae bacterium]
MTRVGDHLGRAILAYEVFRPEQPFPGSHEARVHLIPDYDPSLDLAMFSPEGKPAAFATGWLNP